MHFFTEMIFFTAKRFWKPLLLLSGFVFLPYLRNLRFAHDLLSNATLAIIHADEAEQTDGICNPLPKFLRDYARFHRKMKGRLGARYLVWRCVPGTVLCGGTGDRLNGIMTALYTAMCNRRVLLVDWPLVDGKSNVWQFLEHQKINWEITPDIASSWSGRTNRDQIFNAIDDYENSFLVNLSVPPEQEKFQFIDMRCNLWSDFEGGFIKTNDTQCLQNLWKEEPPHLHYPHYEQENYLFRTGFWSLFTFSHKVHARKRQMQQKANLLLTKDSLDGTSPPPRNNVSSLAFAGQTTLQPYVAIHIRTGIGTSWEDPLRHGTSDDYLQFYQCAKKLQQRIYERQSTTQEILKEPGPPSLMPIYVAADNNIAKEALHKLDTNATDQTIHSLTDLEVHHVERSYRRGDVLESELTVWAELNVLIEATCLVVSRSGFSDIARWIQPAQGKRCSVQFNMCNEEAIERALQNIHSQTCTYQ